MPANRLAHAQLFYVPIAAAFEAERVADRVDWAVVESCDSPGAGSARGASPRGVQGVVAAALARLDELGWERYLLIGDSHGQAATIEVALARPDRVTGVFISHAAARYKLSGDRPAMTPAVRDAAQQLLDTDYRSFARAVTQLTLGLADDEWVERWLAEVPHPVAKSILGDLSDREPELVTRLAEIDVPVLLGQHKGCVMWTPESFADACAAVPGAGVIRCEGIPVQDLGFIDAVRGVASGVASS
ncbi:MAG: alpha/beta fold hydrolase [Thermoleophilaceae bacterium]